MGHGENSVAWHRDTGSMCERLINASADDDDRRPVYRSRHACGRHGNTFEQGIGRRTQEIATLQIHTSGDDESSGVFRPAHRITAIVGDRWSRFACIVAMLADQSAVGLRARRTHTSTRGTKSSNRKPATHTSGRAGGQRRDDAGPAGDGGDAARTGKWSLACYLRSKRTMKRPVDPVGATDRDRSRP